MKRKQTRATPAEPVVAIFNRQRGRTPGEARIRRLLLDVLAEKHQTAEIAVHWIGNQCSARMNLQFLQHAGPTDIITFDHGSTRNCLRGELFICIPEAVRQAREFGTTWGQELRRYVIHGLLHLRGLDDRDPRSRRRMKREEGRLLRRFS